MELSGKKLKAVKKLAYRLVSPSDIAAILEINNDTFLNAIFDDNNEIAKNFKAGYLGREVDVLKKFKQDVFADILQLEIKQVKDYKAHLIILMHGIRS